MDIQRIGKVIQTEATTINISDFLLTHVPFENLYLDETGAKSISEKKLLESLLAAPDEHKFFMIQGGNGSGKSHLIRWLKEKYVQQTNPEEEAVLLISRAHNTLQDALAQLLESDIFPDEIRENELKTIRNAKSNLTGDLLKRTINSNLALEVENDSNPSALLTPRHKKMLCEYLLNTYIREDFSMEGPLERIRRKIETGNEDDVINSDDPLFVADDFAITIPQIAKHLNSPDERASTAVIRMAENLSDPRRGESLRQSIADYLNTKVSSVIASSMKLQSADFKQLFASLRKFLKTKGINLTLFVEDINSFTGIDEALMEVLLTNHAAEGNHEYCRITSVVGSTNAFYQNKLNSSIQERIKQNIYIQEESILGSPEQLSKFAARYINAIHISDESVSSWFNAGADDTDIPIHTCPHTWANIDCSGTTFSIFPFNSTAIWNLYNQLSTSNRTPRIFLKSIISHVLKLYYTSPETFFLSESNFINTDISTLPQWENPLYASGNRDIDVESALPRSILLRLWGDKTTVSKEGMLGGLTADIFQAFNIHNNITGTPTIPLAVTPAATIVSTAATSTSMPSSEVNSDGTSTDNIATPHIEPATMRRSPQIIALEEELIAWCDNKKPLASQVLLRRLLTNYLEKNIYFIAEGVPEILVDDYFGNTNFSIENKGSTSTSGYVFKRTEENKDFLLALVYYDQVGGRSWNFEGSADYLVTATAWVESHKQELIDVLIKPSNAPAHYDIPLWNFAALYAIKTLFDDIDTSKSSEEILIDLLSQKPCYTSKGNHEKSWVDLQEIVLSDNNYYEIIYSKLRSYFSKTVGAAKSEKVDYLFIDAYDALQSVKKLKRSQWDLSALHVMEKTSSKGLWYNASNFINVFQSKINISIAEEQTQADTQLSFWNELLGNDCSEDSIMITLTSCNDFLRFLRETANESYNPDLFKAFEPSTAPKRLANALTSVEKLKQPESLSKTLTRLSKNPFDGINKFYDAMIAFNKLLNDKSIRFSATIDHESDSIIKQHKTSMSNEIDNMISAINGLGGEQYDNL